jgi:hypothetical protein
VHTGEISNLLIFLGLSLHLCIADQHRTPGVWLAIWIPAGHREKPNGCIRQNQPTQLTVQKKPHFITIAPGLALGYRRNDGAGAWVVRKAIGNGNSEIKKFATADDLEKSNGTTILNYEQARVHANAEAKREGRQ